MYDAPDWALGLMHVPFLRRLTLFTLKNLRVILYTHTTVYPQAVKNIDNNNDYERRSTAATAHGLL